MKRTAGPPTFFTTASSKAHHAWVIPFPENNTPKFFAAGRRIALHGKGVPPPPLLAQRPLSDAGFACTTICRIAWGIAPIRNFRQSTSSWNNGFEDAINRQLHVPAGSQLVPGGASDPHIEDAQPYFYSLRASAVSPHHFSHRRLCRCAWLHAMIG